MSDIDKPIIAVVDDDLEHGSLIAEYLQSNGLDCELFETGERFLESDYSSVSLLVLDVGLLSGKYRSETPKEARAAHPGSFDSRLITDEVRAALEGLHQIASNRNQTLSQLAISWVLRQPTVGSFGWGANGSAAD